MTEINVAKTIKSIITQVATAQIPDTTVPVEFGFYNGGSKIYFTFNYFSKPEYYADDCPQYEVYSAQIHLVCPKTMDVTNVVNALKNALLENDFEFPSVVYDADELGRHIILETSEVV